MGSLRRKRGVSHDSRHDTQTPIENATRNERLKSSNAEEFGLSHGFAFRVFRCIDRLHLIDV